MPSLETIQSSNVVRSSRSTINGNFTALNNAVTQKTTVTVGTFIGADYVCDGAADEVQINAAIAAVAVTGGTVLINAGTYNLAGNIVPASNVMLKGSGIDVTTLVPGAALTGANGDAIRLVIDISSTYAEFIGIEDLTIDCSGQYSGSPYGTAVGTYSNGMTLRGINNLRIERIRIVEPFGFGILVGSEGGLAPYVQNLYMNHIFIEGERNGNDSIGGGGINNGIVQNYFFQNGYGSVLDFTNITNLTHRNIWAKRTTTISQNTHAYGVSTDFGAVNVLYDGIWLDGSNQGMVIGSNSAGQSSKIKIKNAFITNCQKSAIYFDSTATYGVPNIEIAGVEISEWNKANNGSQGIVLFDNQYGSLHHCTFGSQTNPSYALRLNSQDSTGPSDFSIHENDFTQPANKIQQTFVGSNVKIRNNKGVITESSGTTIVANGTTSIVVNHGLAITPTSDDISVTPTNNLGNATKFWISALSATQFTINVDVDPGATTATFAWKAIVL